MSFKYIYICLFVFPDVIIQGFFLNYFLFFGHTIIICWLTIKSERKMGHIFGVGVLFIQQ